MVDNGVGPLADGLSLNTFLRPQEPLLDHVIPVEAVDPKAIMKQSRKDPLSAGHMDDPLFGTGQVLPS
jgi:hypothetical protein